MQQSLVEVEERKISKDRSANFRGIARVRLECLNFDSEDLEDLEDLKAKDRDEDIKNVERLEEIFKTGGIWRLEPRHYIPAFIDKQTLDSAIQNSKTSLKDLLENPEEFPPELKFPPNYHLECLHGRHRIEAARKVLTPKSNWWIVSLYLKGMILEVQDLCLTLTFSSRCEFRAEKGVSRRVFKLAQLF